MSSILLLFELVIVLVVLKTISASSIDKTTTDDEFLKLSFVNGGPNYENFNSIAEKLSRTARVISAISLINGLSNGTIPIDNMITEFMNLESSVDLKKLETFDTKSVNDLADKAPTVSGEGAFIEKNLADAYSIKKLWTSVGDLSQLPDDATYKKLEDIEKIDIDGLKKIQIPSIIDSVEKFDSLDAQGINNLKTAIKSIQNEAKKSEKTINYPDTLSTLEKLKTIGNINQVFQIYSSMGNFNGKTPEKQKVKAAFDSLSGVKQLISNSEPTLQVMKSVISTQVLYPKTERLYTSGFVKGYKDLDKLAEDAKDNWMLQQINGSIDINGIIHLIRLRAPMQVLEENWSGLSNRNEYSDLNQAVMFHQQATSLPDAPTGAELDNAINTLAKCDVSAFDPRVVNKIGKVGQSVDELHTGLTALKSIHELTGDKNIEDIASKLSSTTSQEDMYKLSEFLQKIKLHQAILSDGFAQFVIDLTTQDTKYITDFQTNSEVIKKLGCFKNLDAQFVKVAETAEASYHLRQLKDSKSLDSVKSVAAEMSKSFAPLKEIRSVATRIQNDKSEEITSLSGLKELQKTSKAFGEAATAVAMMKTAFDKAEKFQNFVKYGRLIAGDASSGLMPKSEFGKFWGDFEETSRRIQSMLTGVRSLISSLKVSKTANLQDFGQIFNSFPTIDDVDLETDNRLIALLELNNGPVSLAFIDQIEKFEKHLFELSKMDLKFSRFQSSWKSMPNSLKEVSNSFAKSSIPNKVGGNSKPGASKLVGVNSTTAATPLVASGFEWGVIISIAPWIISGLAIVFWCLILIIFCLRNRSQWCGKQCDKLISKLEKKKKKKPKSSASSSTPQSPSNEASAATGSKETTKNEKEKNAPPVTNQVVNETAPPVQPSPAAAPGALATAPVASAAPGAPAVAPTASVPVGGGTESSAQAPPVPPAGDGSTVSSQALMGNGAVALVHKDPQGAYDTANHTDCTERERLTYEDARSSIFDDSKKVPK